MTINYYGMIEQTGSIYLECERDFFSLFNFSDVFVRDKNLKILPNKKRKSHSNIVTLAVKLPWT